MEAVAEIRRPVVLQGPVAKAGAQSFGLQKAMLDATPDCIKVVSLDGRLLTMNRAGCLALNVPEDSGFGMPWLPLLPAEVHPAGQAALRQAAAGQCARFPGRSDSPGGTIHWDNLLTPILDASGRVVSILCVSREVTAKARLEDELEEAIRREKLLSREMQHRIKNLFAVVSGLITIAEKEASQEAHESATRILRDKMAALSRASDAAFTQVAGQEETVREVDLATLVASVLRPYGARCAMAGGKAMVSRGLMTNLALFLHELATNSMKYGALGTEAGRVAIHWAVAGDGLDLTWTESGGPPILAAPARVGFGGEMMDRILRASGGFVERDWRRDGLRVALRLPNPARG